MAWKVGELATLARVSIRTLHHYDAIALLRPTGRSEAGYRIYEVDDLERLQQLLFFRELGFSLKDIRRIMTASRFDRRRALLAQRELLREKARRTKAMVEAIDRALERGEGSRGMKEKEMFEVFEGFDPADYEEEVKARWGETDAYQESSRRTKGYGKKDWEAIQAEGTAIFEAMARAMDEGAAATNEVVAALVERHRMHIDRWFYPCSRAQHAELAQMYVSDTRFEAYYERIRKGLAAYVHRAILAALD